MSGPSPGSRRWSIVLFTLCLLSVISSQSGSGREPSNSDGTWHFLESLYPPYRVASGIVHDPRRNQLVLLDGNYSLWLLDLDDNAARWSRQLPTPPVPAAARQYSLSYSHADDALLLLESRIWDGPLTLRRYSLLTREWIEIPIANAGPAGFSRSKAVVDHSRGILYLVLRRITQPGDQYRTELWGLTLGPVPTWRQLPSPMGAQLDGGGMSPVIDTRRDRLILIMEPAVHYFDLSGDSGWRRVIPTDPRSFRTFGWVDQFAAYDSLHDRVILNFTGPTNPPVVAELRFDSGDRWAFPDCCAPWAQGRFATQDFAGGRMLTFGNTFITGETRNDVFEVNFTESMTWKLLATAPTGFFGTRIVYDSERDRIVRCGGTTTVATSTGPQATYEQGVWTSPADNPTAFSRIPATNVHGEEYGMVLDPARNRLILLGGKTYTFGCESRSQIAHFKGSMTVVDLVSGTSRTTPGPPEASAFTSLVDPLTPRLLIIGGYATRFVGCSGSPRSELINHDGTRALDLAGETGWTLLPGSPASPERRVRAALAYDETRDQILVHGGYQGGSSSLNDLWIAKVDDTMHWREVTTFGVGPPPIDNHSMVYDFSRDRFVVMGSNHSTQGAGSLWMYTPWDSTWRVPNPDQPRPPGGKLPSLAFDTRRDRIVVAGMSREQKDLWALQFHDPARRIDVTPLGTGTVRLYDGDRLMLSAVVPASNDFDPARIDPASISLNHGPTESTSRRWLDVDGDNRDDLVLSCPVTETDRTIPVNKRRVDARMLSGQRVFGVGAVKESAAAPIVNLSILVPNPVRSTPFLVRVDLPGSEAGSFALFDVLGRRRAFHRVDGGQPGERLILIDETEHLADGHYFLKVEQGGKSATKKILLLRGSGH